MLVNEKIEALRRLMREKGIDVYYVPNEDDHLSEEYTADYFKSKSFLTGFSGEAGCAIVTQDFAGLWTDGRYFTQAEGELSGTCVKLMRLHQEGVPNPMDFLISNTPENGLLGFDGNVVGSLDSKRLSNALAKKGARLHIEDDLVGEIWGNKRPRMPRHPVFVLDEKYTGETAHVKIERVREKMREKEADVLVLTRLEDPCWMLNIRGDDIECTPVAYAFAMVFAQKVLYYIDEDQIDGLVRDYLGDNGVEIKAYDDLANDLASLHGKRIWVALGSLNTKLYSSIAQDNLIINEVSPVAMFRAVKNDTELANTRNAHLKDAVAMVRFLRYVKENVTSGKMSEVIAQEYLYRLREQQDGYIEPSFPTICAYQENGAMMHYCATEENHAMVKPRGFLLVDSGGTYFDGTTDITRTIALSGLSDEEKMYYTLVLKGHLALANAKFLQGSSGYNLDILARQPLWQIGIDYQCGTGHGVGHVLSVHEGPHGIRWGMPSPLRPCVALVPGMIVTDEPGVYLPHKLGIRIENELIVTKAEKNEYGQFLAFENLTYVPYERDAIDLSYLSDQEIKQINDYHAMVFSKLKDRLAGADLAWLKEATAPLSRV